MRPLGGFFVLAMCQSLESLAVDLMALSVADIRREPGETDDQLRDRLSATVMRKYTIEMATADELNMAMGVVTPDEIVASRFKMETIIPVGKDPDRYPHVCPHCGGPAYIGLATVDCSWGCK